MKQYNYIFWDFDGTLVNTIRGTREAATYALNNLNNIKNKKCIMIGDRSSDIIAGKANNMDTIGVLYGMDNKEMLEKAGATFLVNNPLEILRIIEE